MRIKRYALILGLFTTMLVGCSATDAKQASPPADTQQSQQEDPAVDAPTEQTEEEKRLLQTTDAMPQLDPPKAGDTIAEVTTNQGVIKIKLLPEQAPKSVENFTALVKDGYYNGLIFHRVINDFMIQGGDPTGTGTGGESTWKAPFEDEFSPEAYNFRGALSMANSGPNTNGSQFFIVQAKKVEDNYFEQLKQIADQYGTENLLMSQQTGKIVRTNYTDAVKNMYAQLGGTPHLDYGHTVFGQVFEGMDVVDGIAAVEVGEADKPIEDMKIEGIEITQYQGE